LGGHHTTVSSADHFKRQQFIAIIKALHSVSIAPWVLDWHDVWTGPDGTIKIVNFESADYLEEFTQKNSTA
jgi:hypothetical protein